MAQAVAISDETDELRDRFQGVLLGLATGDAFGALATLPLYCLGELPSPDPRAIILDHYEVWRSYLIVVRQVLKADSDAPDTAHDS